MFESFFYRFTNSVNIIDIKLELDIKRSKFIMQLRWKLNRIFDVHVICIKFSSHSLSYYDAYFDKIKLKTFQTLKLALDRIIQSSLPKKFWLWLHNDKMPKFFSYHKVRTDSYDIFVYFKLNLKYLNFQTWFNTNCWK